MRVAHHRVGEFYYCRFERFFGCRQPFFYTFLFDRVSFQIFSAEFIIAPTIYWMDISYICCNCVVFAACSYLRYDVSYRVLSR